MDFSGIETLLKNKKTNRVYDDGDTSVEDGINVSFKKITDQTIQKIQDAIIESDVTNDSEKLSNSLKDVEYVRLHNSHLEKAFKQLPQEDERLIISSGLIDDKGNFTIPEQLIESYKITEGLDYEAKSYFNILKAVLLQKEFTEDEARKSLVMIVLLTTFRNAHNSFIEWSEVPTLLHTHLSNNIDDFYPFVYGDFNGSRIIINNEVKEAEEWASDLINGRNETISVRFITGKGGTGKTSRVIEEIKEYRENGMSVGVFTPTHAARMRIDVKIKSFINNVRTGVIHQLGSTKFAFDVIFIDESSMISSELFIILKNNSGKYKEIVFIGDWRQLQPVGHGDFMKKHFRNREDTLTQVFRTEHLNIINLAENAILQERNPHGSSISELASPYLQKDIVDYSPTVDLAIDHAVSRGIIEKHLEWHFVTFKNVDVKMINDLIYFRIAKKEFKGYLDVEGLKIRSKRTVKDKMGRVLYANNDMFTIKRFYTDTDGRAMAQLQNLFVDDHVVETTRANLDFNFTLCYCSTVHTTQGLGFGIVYYYFTPQFSSQRRQWTINSELFYTAITRAINQVVIICPMQNTTIRYPVVSTQKITFHSDASNG